MLVGSILNACSGGRPLLSSSEVEYIAGGVALGARADGRACEDWRAVRGAECGVIKQAAGSARVNVGGTDVLVTIKGDIGQPAPERPDEGLIVCTVDSSSTMSANDGDERSVGERNGALAAILDDVLVRGGREHLRMLSIASGRHCWVLHVDVLILDSSGNVIDVVVMATRLALASLSLPAVCIEEGSESTEIVLADEVDPLRRIRAPEDLPVAITVTCIGEGFVIDPSLAEEVCSQAALLIVLLPVTMRIVSIRKIGNGLIDPGLFQEYARAAKRAAVHFASAVARVALKAQ